MNQTVNEFINNQQYHNEELKQMLDNALRENDQMREQINSLTGQ